MLEWIFLNLYGFLPQRGTHHCLLELYTRLTYTSVAAFIDLKNAFDTFDQLIEFGVKGKLLTWIRSTSATELFGSFLRVRTVPLKASFSSGRQAVNTYPPPPD